MDFNRRAFSVVTMAVVSLLASSSLAVDLTGTWSVSGSCRDSDNSGSTPYKYSFSGRQVEISQTGSFANGSIVDPFSPVPLTGIVISDSGDSSKGSMTLVPCGTSSASNGPWGSSVLSFVGKTGDGGTGKLKGLQVSSYVDAAYNQASFCKLKLERLNSVDPLVGSCNP